MGITFLGNTFPLWLAFIVYTSKKAIVESLFVQFLDREREVMDVKVITILHKPEHFG